MDKETVTDTSMTLEGQAEFQKRLDLLYGSVMKEEWEGLDKAEALARLKKHVTGLHELLAEMGVGSDEDARAKWVQEFFEKITADHEADSRPVSSRRPKPQPIADSDGLMKIAGDRINQSTMIALTPGAMKPASAITPDLEGLSARGMVRATEMRYGYVFNYRDDIKGAIGFYDEPGAAHWAMIQKNGELAVRVQCALWAHAYAETGGDPEPGKFITLNISNLCDSLGYKRHPNGGHHAKNKQAVKEQLEALTQIELLVLAKLKNGKTARLKGSLWTQGMESDTKEPNSTVWEPHTFAYAPGPFFANPGWREYNHSFALVGENLLKLQGLRDKWAVMIGGYLATLSVMNDYQPKILKVVTLLEKSGLLRELNERAGRMRDYVEQALDRLVEVGVIAKWRYDKTGLNTEEPDGLNEAAVEGMHKDSKADWRSWNVVINWPAKAQELGEKHLKQIARKARNRTRRRPKA